MTLQEFVEQISVSTEALFRANGLVRPTYHIVLPTNETVTLPAPPLPKRMSVALMRDVIAKIGTKRMCFVDEAWVIRSPPEHRTIEQIKAWRKTVPQPMDHPDRQEVLLFIGEDENEGFYNARRFIERDADGNGTLGPLSGPEENPKMAFGDLIGMLPGKGTKQ